MFDLNKISKRYFDIKVRNVRLQLEAPTKKMLNKVVSLSGVKDIEAPDTLYEAVNMILNKNKTHYKVTKEFTDGLDIDEIIVILSEYFNWIKNTKNSPN
ncbi:hypothetical protein [Clostridium sp. 001]|uniref:hypothetical protein n=1 Tax=Clostridium sp. 001 TaxID=1970093 RepID=UPI001C2C04F4|nr:hypothetical protein [Clostridium sp. 001]QXE20000.1 hypothetical protein B5S50_14870 [Clostridium sp. 001]